MDEPDLPSANSSDELMFAVAGVIDVPAVVTLVESAYRGEASRAGWTTEADLLAGQRTDAALVADLVRRPDSVVVLARRDAALVGCCHVASVEPGLATFGMFAVAPSRQGAGIGRAILSEAERVARDRWHATRMQMTVLSQRRDLIAFYERRGYQVTGAVEPFPYGDERYGLPLRDDLEFAVLERLLE